MMEVLSAHISANVVIYVLSAMLLSVIAIAVGLFATFRLRTAMRPFSMVRGETDEPSSLLPAVLRTVENCEANSESVASTLRRHVERSRNFVQHVGLVRYDAFEDISGMQSYSLCLLDAVKNGVILTYLTGKNSTRSYAVPVADGEAARDLSDEERQAMDQAVSQELVVTPS